MFKLTIPFRNLNNFAIYYSFKYLVLITCKENISLRDLPLMIRFWNFVSFFIKFWILQRENLPGLIMLQTRLWITSVSLIAICTTRQCLMFHQYPAWICLIESFRKQLLNQYHVPSTGQDIGMTYWTWLTGFLPRLL